MSIKATFVVSPKQQFEMECEFTPAKGNRFRGPDKRDYVVTGVDEQKDGTVVVQVKGLSPTGLDPRQSGSFKKGNKK